MAAPLWLPTRRRPTPAPRSVALAVLLAIVFAAVPTEATTAAASFPLKVNFQDESTSAPAGYARDFGQAFGPRTGSGQGAGLSYGWVQPGTTAPLSLVGNGRNRGGVQPDVRLATLVHMQLPANAGAGVKAPGSWEVQVPNGTYTVTVAVGDDGGALDSTHRITVETTVAISGFVPTATEKHATATRTVSVADGRLTLSAAGGTNTKVNYVDVVPAAPSAAKVNFQDEAAVPPGGYVRDFGQAYGARTGPGQGAGLSYGWVQPGTTAPVSLVGNGRNRGSVQPDVRLATLMHMQLPENAGTGVKVPGSWEIAVPNGTYAVTVAVGDAGTALDSNHWLNVEDQNAVAAFRPTSTVKHATVTRTVSVGDGRLTLGAAGGTNTKVHYVDLASSGSVNEPRVRSVTPANLSTGAPPTGAVVADLVLPNAGVDPSTLLTGRVSLRRVADGAPVAGTVSTSGGGDTIAFAPTAPLQPSTLYRFDVTGGVRDLSGAAFAPWSTVFTTGTTATGAVTFVNGGTVAQGKFTSMVKGPDGKLYAATVDGYIHRWTIAPDGTLTGRETFTTVRDRAVATGSYGAPARTVIGLVFDPRSTATEPVLWITDNPQFSGTYDVPDLSSSIARLSGPGLRTYTEIVAHLPRSIKDHEVNSLAFGHDGAVYVNVGAMNAMGDVDTTWKRVEHLLSAAVLRLDPTRLPTTLPIDARTPDVGGTYDPFAVGAALTIHASGIRNAYDLVWHTNGHLYVPTNGSAAGGNTPQTPTTPLASCSRRIDAGRFGPWTGPQVPAVTNNPQSETDYVFDVRAGRYYGHPNPARCEWVLNNGNPTSGVDPFQVGAYSVGTLPDRNYDLAGVYDAGLHASANGAVEYRNGAFAGALRGSLLVARYSAFKDVVYFGVAPDGRLSGPRVLNGLTGLVGPLDVTEDPARGTLYVSELDAGRLTLFRPQMP
jgi:hypothetical protein